MSTETKPKKRTATYVAGIVLILVILAGVGYYFTSPAAATGSSSMTASAQSTSGYFNPQTQFPIGSTVTVTSVYGLGGVGMPFFNPGVRGNWTKGNQSHSWAQNNQSRTRIWNQTGRTQPSFSASLTLTAQVTNDTANGGITWTIKSGSIIENGTTLTITRGEGGISKADRILVGGNVTDSNGHTYRWRLEGLAAIYNGTVIASLNGGSSYNPNPATPTTQKPSSANRRPRGTRLSFIATVT